MKIEGGLDFEALKLQDQPDDVTALPSIDKQPSYASGLPDSNIVAWRPPPEWNIVLPGGLRHDKRLPPTPGDEEKEVAVARDSPIELTRFQRFIRRMESAGPKIILDRMKEEWHDPVDAEADEELILEKQLWVLTAFQLQNLGQSRTAPRPQCNTGKILELYGNLGKSFVSCVVMTLSDRSVSGGLPNVGHAPEAEGALPYYRSSKTNPAAWKRIISDGTAARNCPLPLAGLFLFSHKSLHAALPRTIGEATSGIARML